MNAVNHEYRAAYPLKRLTFNILKYTIKAYLKGRKTMKKEERVLNIINRKPVDYLPSQITFSDRLRHDEISKAMNLPPEMELEEYLQNHIHLSFTTYDMPLFFSNDLKTMEELQQKGFVGIDYEKEIVYDMFGTSVEMNTDGVWFSCGLLEKNEDFYESQTKYLPKSIDRAILDMDFEDAIKNYQPPDPYCIEAYEYMQQDFDKYSGDLLVIPSAFNGVYEKAYCLIGFEKLMLLSAEDPVILGELLEKVADYRAREAEMKIKLGAKIGHVSDDLGTQISSLFSPAMFKDIFLPHLKKIFDVYKNAGLPMVLHSCGKITEYLPSLIDAGLDVWEPVQPCNDLEFIKREYGKDLIFWGGIDTQRLPWMKPDEVREMTRNTIRILGKGGGYIIAPSQDIMKDIPIPNIVAMLEVIFEERERAM